MCPGLLVFTRDMDFLPMKKFRRCKDLYQGNHQRQKLHLPQSVSSNGLHKL